MSKKEIPKTDATSHLDKNKTLIYIKKKSIKLIDVKYVMYYVVETSSEMTSEAWSIISLLQFIVVSSNFCLTFRKHNLCVQGFMSFISNWTYTKIALIHTHTHAETQRLSLSVLVFTFLYLLICCLLFACMLFVVVFLVFW